MIRHVVLMRFTNPSHAPEAKARLEALVGRIPELLALEAGLDVLGSEASYDLSLVTSHADLDALRAYQSHPAHAAFGHWVTPLLADRAVVDSED